MLDWCYPIDLLHPLTTKHELVFISKSSIINPMNGQYSLHVHVSRVEDGQFLATSDDLPGLVAQGRTIAETIEIARDVARKLLESYIEHNDPIPQSLKPLTDDIELDVAVGV